MNNIEENTFQDDGIKLRRMPFVAGAIGLVMMVSGGTAGAVYDYRLPERTCDPLTEEEYRIGLQSSERNCNRELTPEEILSFVTFALGGVIVSMSSMLIAGELFEVMDQEEKGDTYEP